MSEQKKGYKVRKSTMTKAQAMKNTTRSKEPIRLTAETTINVREDTKTEAAKKKKKRSSAEMRELGRRSNTFIKPTDVVRIKGSPDMVLMILVIILTLFGLIIDFSSSYAYASIYAGDSFYFIKRQAVFAVIGIGGMLIMSRFDYQWIRKLTLPLYIFTIGLLGVVLLYGFAVGEAQRWIKIGGQTVQPSEIAKMSIVLTLALYVSRNQNRIINYSNFRQSTTYGIIVPLIIVGIPSGMILLENHFSGTIIVALIGIILIFTSGGRRDILVIAAAAVVVVIVIFMLFSSYARTRLDMWINPDNYDPKGSIWQTLQGLYAIGSGGLFGVGLGNSKQKFLFVAQPQNDFVFSILCEELGFTGAVIVIVLFMLLVWRGFMIALRAPDTFSSLTALGLTIKVGLQAILNIAVVTNTIPNTGISLPFFSYGGTALVVQLGEMGILLAISKYTYRENTAVVGT